MLRSLADEIGAQSQRVSNQRLEVEDVTNAPAPRAHGRSLPRVRGIAPSGADSRVLRGYSPSLGTTEAGRGPTKTGFLYIGPQGFVRSRLPARTGCSVSGGNVAVNAQTNQLLRETLLRSALASVPTNRCDRFLGQHLHQRPRLANLFGRPLGVLRVRTTGVLSHTLVPLAAPLNERESASDQATLQRD